VIKSLVLFWPPAFARHVEWCNNCIIPIVI